MSHRSEERSLDRALRPASLDDYLGQPRAAALARVAVAAARRRGEPLDHVLIEGPAGLGKTTLAGILAAEMGAGLRVAHAATLRRPEDLVGTLTRLYPGDVLFVDEVHAMPREVQEYLYTAMEDRRIDLLVGDGPGARLVPFPLVPFTLVGATTRGGNLDAPFRARFGLHLQLAWYAPEDLETLLRANCPKLGIGAPEPGAVSAIAARARGTPRVANRLLRRARDFATVRGEDRTLTAADAEAALAAEGIDALGLTDLDRELLRTLVVTFQGGPAGLSALAASLGRSADELAEVCEPYLLRTGLLARTPRGRRATGAAYRHLGIPPAESDVGRRKGGAYVAAN